MIRDMVVFDYDKCTGCGACVGFCGKGIIEMRDHKPHHVEDRMCDGLGVCVPYCRFGAISVQKRDVDPYDAAAVREYHRTR